MTRILGFHVLGIPLIAWSISIPFLLYAAFEFLFWRWRVKERRLDSQNYQSGAGRISFNHLSLQERGDSEDTRVYFLVPVAAFLAFSTRAEARYLHPGEPSRPMPPALNAFLLVVAAIGVGFLLWAFWSVLRDEREVRRQARALERFRRVNGKKQPCNYGSGPDGEVEE